MSQSQCQLVQFIESLSFSIKLWYGYLKVFRDIYDLVYMFTVLKFLYYSLNIIFGFQGTTTCFMFPEKVFWHLT